MIREFEFENGKLESIQKVQLLEDGRIRINYTITDEYKEKYQLFYKKRILEINNNVEIEAAKFMDYADTSDN